MKGRLGRSTLEPQYDRRAVVPKHCDIPLYFKLTNKTPGTWYRASK